MNEYGSINAMHILSKIFNTRGKSIKSIDFDILDLTKKEIILLLSNDGKLIFFDKTEWKYFLLGG